MNIPATENLFESKVLAPILGNWESWVGLKPEDIKTL